MRPADNPFRADRVEAVAFRPLDWTWNDVIDRLRALRYRAAIVGPEGSGKTTLLLELSRRLAAGGLPTLSLRLDASGRLPRGVPAGHIILLDSVETLSTLAWLRVRFALWNAGGLIVTTHRPMRLPTLVELRTSPDLLRRIIDDLLAGKRLDVDIDPAVLWQRHDGNIRSALRELYDLCADQISPKSAYSASESSS